MHLKTNLILLFGMCSSLLRSLNFYMHVPFCTRFEIFYIGSTHTPIWMHMVHVQFLYMYVMLEHCC